jgi:HlyD family secretion protein
MEKLWKIVMGRFKRPIYAVAALILAPMAAQAQDQDLLFTGTVFSQQAQEIFVPLTNNWQARISMMLAEGTEVEVGDLVVEFDGSEAARQLEQQQQAQRTEQAKTERDIAKLDQDLNSAKFQLEQANVALELASLKAGVPEGLIGGLEYAENQLSKEKAIKDVDDAIEWLKDRQKSAAERNRQAELDRQKGENQIELWNQMLASFTIHATQPGFIIYGIHPWNRTKFQEGDTVRTSFRVAQIADTSELAIKVFINSIDRPRVEAGTRVNIMLDALPELQLEGRLDSVSDSGARRSEWGGALYYEAVVLFESSQLPDLLPGMSALVEPQL